MKHFVTSTLVMFLCGVIHAQLTWTPMDGNPVLLPTIDPLASSIYAPAVVKHKGKYHLYYTRKVGPKAETIGHSISDDGLAWTLVDTLAIGLSPVTGRFDTKQLGQPTLISEGDTLKMWYWGSGPAGGNIGMAWSLDGTAWNRVDGANTDKSVYSRTQDGSNSPAIACPNVIKVGSGYKMWYSGIKIAGTTISYFISHATSPDGLVWTKVNGAGYGGSVLEVGASGDLDAATAFFPTVLLDGGTYHMWYDGASANDDYSIGYATSTDGITWLKVKGNLALGAVVIGATQSVMKSGAGFKMWYMGDTGLFYATSGLPVGINIQANRLDPKPSAFSSQYDSRGRNIHNRPSCSIIKIFNHEQR